MKKEVKVRGCKALKEIELFLITVYAKDIDGDFKKWCKRNLLGSTIRRTGVFMRKTTDTETTFEISPSRPDSVVMVKYLSGLYTGDFKHTEIRIKPYLGSVEQEPLTKQEIKDYIKIYKKQQRKDKKELILGSFLWGIIKGLF